jgi:hypothetical protein
MSFLPSIQRIYIEELPKGRVGDEWTTALSRSDILNARFVCQTLLDRHLGEKSTEHITCQCRRHCNGLGKATMFLPPPFYSLEWPAFNGTLISNGAASGFL